MNKTPEPVSLVWTQARESGPLGPTFRALSSCGRWRFCCNQPVAGEPWRLWIWRGLNPVPRELIAASTLSEGKLAALTFLHAQARP